MDLPCRKRSLVYGKEHRSSCFPGPEAKSPLLVKNTIWIRFTIVWNYPAYTHCIVLVARGLSFLASPSSQLIIEFSIFSVNKWNAIQVFNTRHSFLMTNDHNLGGKSIQAQPQPWSSRSRGRVDLKLGHGVPGSSGTSRFASLETKHLGGSAGPCHGHGGDWSLDSSKLGASNIQLSLLDWIFPELQGTHFLESFTFAGKSKVSCRFSLKEHVRDAVFSLNSFSGLWIMWLVVENGLYTPMILWPIQLEKPSARFVAKPELAQCVSLNSFGVKNFG